MYPTLGDVEESAEDAQKQQLGFPTMVHPHTFTSYLDYLGTDVVYLILPQLQTIKTRPRAPDHAAPTIHPCDVTFGIAALAEIATGQRPCIEKAEKVTGLFPTLPS